MGKSMMSYNSKTLWMSDYNLEPITYFVHSSLENKLRNNLIDKEHRRWFEEYNQNLVNLFMGANDGALDLEFDRLEARDYCMTLIRNILYSTSIFLKSININLDPSSFRAIGVYRIGSYANCIHR